MLNQERIGRAVVSRIALGRAGEVAALHESQNERPADLDYIQRCIAAYPSSFVQVDDQVVGFAYTTRMAPDILILSNLLVATEFRGQGLGSRLLDHVEEQASNSWASVLVSNSDLWPRPQRRSPLDFYASRGYQVVWRTRDTVIWAKNLQPDRLVIGSGDPGERV